MNPTMQPNLGNLDDGNIVTMQYHMHETFRGAEQIFRTNATGLWAAYINAFPAHLRQQHNCHACRRFIEHYGGLVRITTYNTLKSAVWPDVNSIPEEYQPSIRAVLRLVYNAEITGLFYATKPLGKMQTGHWRHLAIDPGSTYFSKLPHNPHKVAAAKRQMFHCIDHTLADYNKTQINTALELAKQGRLAMGHAFIGPLEFLCKLHEDIREDPSYTDNTDNIIWRHIATAPEAFGHFRSSVIATFLNDMKQGVDLAEANKKLAAKQGLSAWTIGTHEGWRVVGPDEERPEDAEFYIGNSWQKSDLNHPRDKSSTYRTKAPKPSKIELPFDQLVWVRGKDGDPYTWSVRSLHDFRDMRTAGIIYYCIGNGPWMEVPK